MQIRLTDLREVIKAHVKRPDTAIPPGLHIEAGLRWLARAQDATPDGGVAIRYSMLRGWESSYPETTGYIIPTFIKYSKTSGDGSFMNRAIRMAEWELSIQQPDGSFIGGPVHKGVGKMAFDTGQIIFGLLAAHSETGEEKFMQAALRAGDWLAKTQDADGAWRQNAYNSMPHAYYTRVAWPLIKLATASGSDKYMLAGIRNLDWALSQQEPNGWFRHGGFSQENNRAPFTHTIAYAVRGLLESGILLDRPAYIEAAMRSADRLCEVMEPQGFFWGRYDKDWRVRAKYSCLTGNAQISIIFLRLFARTGGQKYLDAARKLNAYLRAKQNVMTAGEDMMGALPGSHLFWGEYERLAYPNWGTKFLVDALTLEKELGGGAKTSARP